jgi:hypothetical protein
VTHDAHIHESIYGISPVNCNAILMKTFEKATTLSQNQPLNSFMASVLSGATPFHWKSLRNVNFHDCQPIKFYGILLLSDILLP